MPFLADEVLFCRPDCLFPLQLASLFLLPFLTLAPASRKIPLPSQWLPPLSLQPRVSVGINNLYSIVGDPSP